MEIDCSDSGTFETLDTGLLDLSKSTITYTSPEYIIVNIEQAGIEQKVRSRYDTTINLNKLETIDGTALTEFTRGDDNYTLNLHSKLIKYTSLLNLQENNPHTESDTYTSIFGSGFDINWYLTPVFNNIEFDDALGINIPTYYIGNDLIDAAELSSGEPIFPDYIFQNTSSESVTYSVETIITGTLTVSGTNATPDSFTIKLKYATNSATLFPGASVPLVGTVINDYGSFVTPGLSVPVTETIDISDTRNIVVPAGHYLWIVFHVEGLTVDSFESSSVSITASTGNIKLTESSLTAASTAKAFAIFEAGARIAQSITNSTDAFRSDYFGRVDAEPFAADENGCASFTALTNGYQIRQFPLADSGTTPNLIHGRPIYTSLKDYFESLSAIHNLGLGIEDGQYIRIEPIEYFYNTEVLFQIPNIKNYKIRTADEFYVNGFEVGYDKWETEDVNGLDEVNTKREYTTLLKKTGTKVSKLSKYIASPYALELTRRKQYLGTSTQDSKYDQENFVICLNRTENPYTGIPTSLTTAEKDENFTVTNLISSATTYNLRISPGRIIRRWFKSIAPSLIKNNAILKVVKFAFGQGNYKATSQGSGSCDVGLSENIDESADLELEVPAIDTSIDPLWENEFIEFEAPMTYSQYKLIKINPTKCIQISPYSSNFIKAFIFDVRYNPVRGMAKFILLKAYEQDNDCTHLYVEAGYVECGYVE